MSAKSVRFDSTSLSRSPRRGATEFEGMSLREIEKQAEEMTKRNEKREKIYRLQKQLEALNPRKSEPKGELIGKKRISTAPRGQTAIRLSPYYKESKSESISRNPLNITPEKYRAAKITAPKSKKIIPIQIEQPKSAATPSIPYRPGYGLGNWTSQPVISVDAPVKNTRLIPKKLKELLFEENLLQQFNQKYKSISIDVNKLVNKMRALDVQTKKSIQAVGDQQWREIMEDFQKAHAKVSNFSLYIDRTTEGAFTTEHKFMPYA